MIGHVHVPIAVLKLIQHLSQPIFLCFFPLGAAYPADIIVLLICRTRDRPPSILADKELLIMGICEILAPPAAFQFRSYIKTDLSRSNELGINHFKIFCRLNIFFHMHTLITKALYKNVNKNRLLFIEKASITIFAA
jgi:hypothetical protein